MYSLPQEIEVWYIIPTIRREIARNLVKKGMIMEKAGEILGVTKAAISQYLSKKRADRVKLTGRIKKEIKNSADIIEKDNKKAVSEIMRILALMRKDKCECYICKKYNKGMKNLCSHGGVCR